MTTPERPAVAPAAPQAPPQPIEPDDTTLAAWLRETSDYAFRQMSGVADQPSWNTESAAAVVERVRNEPLPERGRPLGEVMAKLDPAIQASFTTTGPGYLAYIPGGGLPSAAMADLIACATNRFVN